MKSNMKKTQKNFESLLAEWAKLHLLIRNHSVTINSLMCNVPDLYNDMGTVIETYSIKQEDPFNFLDKRVSLTKMLEVLANELNVSREMEAFALLYDDRKRFKKRIGIIKRILLQHGKEIWKLQRLNLLPKE